MSPEAQQLCQTRRQACWNIWSSLLPVTDRSKIDWTTALYCRQWQSIPRWTQCTRPRHVQGLLLLHHSFLTPHFSIQHLQHILLLHYHTPLPSILVYTVPTSPTSLYSSSITGDIEMSSNRMVGLGWLVGLKDGGNIAGVKAESTKYFVARKFYNC